MDQERDSLGALAPRGQSSSTTTSERALIAKALGADYERLAGSEIVNRTLFRLIAVYGDPWGRNTAAAKQMAVEWEAALAAVPAKAVDDAATLWMRDKSVWPKPADIRKLADAELDERVGLVSAARNIHPTRLKPPDSFKGFIFNEARDLRRNETWRRFLDSIHPTFEHCYLANARMREHAHEIEGLTPYEAETVIEKFGEQLRSLFGRGVSIKETR